MARRAQLARVEADAGRVIRARLARRFRGSAVTEVRAIERRGKWLLWRFDSEVGLLAHLGMTGKFELKEAGDPMCDGRAFASSRRRRGGSLPRSAAVRSACGSSARTSSCAGPLADLGPDAHEPRLTAKVLHDRIGQRTPHQRRAHGSDGGGRARKHPGHRRTLSARASPSRESRFAHIRRYGAPRKAIHTYAAKNLRHEQGRQDCLRGRDEAHRKSISRSTANPGSPCPRCSHV